MAEMISAMSGAARACQYFLDKNRRYVGKSQPKRTCAPSFGARQTGSAPWAVSGEHERCKGFLAMRGMSVTPAHVVAPIVEVREREGEVLGFACGRGAGATDCQSRAGRRTDVRAAEVAPSPLRAVSDERARIWPGAAVRGAPQPLRAWHEQAVRCIGKSPSQRPKSVGRRRRDSPPHRPVDRPSPAPPAARSEARRACPAWLRPFDGTARCETGGDAAKSDLAAAMESHHRFVVIAVITVVRQTCGVHTPITSARSRVPKAASKASTHVESSTTCGSIATSYCEQLLGPSRNSEGKSALRPSASHTETCPI
jgi:hypothetical protein